MTSISRPPRARLGGITALALAVLSPVPSAAMAQAPTSGRLKPPRAEVPSQPVVSGEPAVARPRMTPAEAPPPTGVTVSGMGVTATVAWQPVAGATGYVVIRWLQSNPNCCRANSGALSATSWTDTGLQWPGDYGYRVSANYADGRSGSADVVFTRPAPQDPVRLLTSLTGPKQVQLSWPEVPGVAMYLVGGPGTPDTGLKVRGTSVTINDVPSGTHKWSVASWYEPGGLLSAASTWPTAALTVRSTEGRYRIVIEGFRVDLPTHDDMLQRDGKGDEVYIATQVNEYRANGVLASGRMAKTTTFGDGNGFPDRVMAGSGLPSGGLFKGDAFPTGWQRGIKPTAHTLPLLLWEGLLTDAGEAVVISPAVWEWDGDARVFNDFAAKHGQVAGNLLQAPNLRVGLNVGSWRPVNRCHHNDPDHVVLGFRPNSYQWGGDEPVDVDHPYYFCPTFVALNRRAFESLLSGGSARTHEIEFYASSPERAYTLFVRLEKAP